MHANAILELVSLGGTVGLILLAAGELFGASSVSLVGVVVFVVAVLAGLPVMTARLVTGTLEEGGAAALDADFDVGHDVRVR